MMSPSSTKSGPMFLLLCSPLLALLLLANSVQSQAEAADEQPMMLEDYMIQQLDKRGPMKKADVSDFIGSLNGASRLRYGKRSGLGLWDPAPIQWNGYRALIPYRWQVAKRVPNYAEALPAGLLDQLNGAERLRFGRK